MTGRGRDPAAPDRAGQQLRAGVVLARASLVLAVVVAVGTALGLGRTVREEDGVVVAALLGLPALCCAGGALGARWRSGWAVLLMVASAAVCLVGSLLAAFAMGLQLLVPPLLLVAATVLSGAGRLERRLDARARRA